MCGQLWACWSAQRLRKCATFRVSWRRARVPLSAGVRATDAAALRHLHFWSPHDLDLSSKPALLLTFLASLSDQ